VTDATPYFDTEEFDDVEYLDLVEKAVWEKARPEIEKMLQSKLRSWARKSPAIRSCEIPAKFAKDYEESMMRGLIFVISNRISEMRGKPPPGRMPVYGKRRIREAKLFRKNCVRKPSEPEARLSPLTPKRSSRRICSRTLSTGCSAASA